MRNSPSGLLGKEQTPHQGTSRSLNLAAEFWTILFGTLKRNIQVLDSKESSIVAKNRALWILKLNLINKSCTRCASLQRSTSSGFRFKIKIKKDINSYPNILKGNKSYVRTIIMKYHGNCYFHKKNYASRKHN